MPTPTTQTDSVEDLCAYAEQQIVVLGLDCDSVGPCQSVVAHPLEDGAGVRLADDHVGVEARTRAEVDELLREFANALEQADDSAECGR